MRYTINPRTHSLINSTTRRLTGWQAMQQLYLQGDEDGLYDEYKQDAQLDDEVAPERRTGSQLTRPRTWTLEQISK